MDDIKGIIILIVATTLLYISFILLITYNYKDLYIDIIGGNYLNHISFIIYAILFSISYSLLILMFKKIDIKYLYIIFFIPFIIFQFIFNTPLLLSIFIGIPILLSIVLTYENSYKIATIIFLIFIILYLNYNQIESTNYIQHIFTPLVSKISNIIIANPQDYMISYSVQIGTKGYIYASNISLSVCPSKELYNALQSNLTIFQESLKNEIETYLSTQGNILNNIANNISNRGDLRSLFNLLIAISIATAFYLLFEISSIFYALFNRIFKD